MRVIEQVRLHDRDGASDRIYEIELVELGPGQHVVNFRSGRRGGALKDGTKTPLPVDLNRARAIYEKLITEKEAGGYRRSPVATAPAPAAERPRDVERILRELPKGARASEKIINLVMRAGDRDLVEAEPYLLELLRAPAPIGSDLGAWRYVVLAALARCGTTASLPALRAIADDAKQAIHHREVAQLAIARIQPRERTAPVDPRAVEELLATDPKAARREVIELYVEEQRAAVLAVARVARLQGEEAAIIRALFRAAEIRRDGELYAIVSRRIDAHRGHHPFGPETRGYLRRRVARVLRRLGNARSPDYVNMAAAILLTYSDADADSSPMPFARFHAFNYILFANSPRYEVGHHKYSAWRRVRRPGVPQREEAFPQLWDRAPDVLWELITDGRAEPVVEFATKAIAPNTAFLVKLSDEAIAEVLAGGLPSAQRFAFSLARTRSVNATLARGALASTLPEAHDWVLAWIDANAEIAINDAELIALIVTGRTQLVRDAAVRLLRGRTLPDAIARSAAARALAVLLASTDEGFAGAAASTLLRLLDAPLREIGPEILRDLIRHPLSAVGELGGELALRHAHRDELPADLIELMLSSPHPAVRTIGGRMLALTPPELAKDDLEALVLFATSPNAELRTATRPLIAEIARRYPDVGRALASALVDGLLMSQPPGVPAHIVSLLREELSTCLPGKSSAVILRLIGALSPHARDAGGLLLPQIAIDEVQLDDLARLASHDSAAIREGARQLARHAIDRYRLAPVALAKLVDSQWDDTRAWAIDFITNEVGAIGPDAIITICDSIRPDVQELGKQLLRAQFKDADGPRYLMRLAEHPSPNLQLVVSALLDRFAHDLAAIVPFLATVLSQVNRGGAAKVRALELIRREANASEAHARILAPLLDRQSATSAITQKHPLISTMVDVRERYPEVPLPIVIIPPKAVP